MAHSIKYKPSVEKEIDSLDGDLKKRIARAIRALADNPRPSGCKKLRGSDLYRIRIGEYRVIYEVRDDVLFVLVLRVGHRSEIYK